MHRAATHSSSLVSCLDEYDGEPKVVVLQMGDGSIVVLLREVDAGQHLLLINPSIQYLTRSDHL